MTARRALARGSTLLELLVVLALLGVIAGVTVLAARRIERPDPADPRAILAESVRVAVDTPRTIVVRIVRDETPLSAAIRADGSVVADSALDMDRLTGRPRAR